MKIDYISYWSAEPYVDVLDLKKNLPISIQEGLLKGEKFQHGIYVETSSVDIIKEVDRIFKIGKTKEIVKYRYLEIDKTEIPNYTHFQINTTELEHDKQLLFEMVPPKCKSDMCPWGSGIDSKITIKQNSLKNLGIAQIGRLWANRPELIISSQTKALFDAENITGLDYEACISESNKTFCTSGKSDAYCSMVLPETYQLADDILLKIYCKKHLIINNYQVFNLLTPKEAILNSDFQVIRNLKVGKKIFSYYRGYLIVSRKVLELLLKHKIPGLKHIGYVLGQKFIPLIIG